MAERIGVCAGCGSKFKIPPTFEGTKAKCKKCGGVVEIPPLDKKTSAPAKPQKRPAPKAKKTAAPAAKAPPKKVAIGGKKKAKSVPAPDVKGMSATKRAAGGARGSRKGRKRKASAGESKDMKWVWIGGGAGVVIVIVILVLILSGGDDENLGPAATDQTARAVSTTSEEEAAAAQSTTARATEGETAAEGAEVTEETVTEAEEKPKTEAPGAFAMPEDFESNPVIEFELLPPLIGCSQERFEELTNCFTEIYIKQELPAYKRRSLIKTVDESIAEDYDTVPIFLNAFNGLNLLDANHVALGFSISKEWNKFTGKRYFDCNFKGGVEESEMRENLKNNYTTIHSLVNLWRTKYSEDEELQQAFIENVEKARALQAKRDARDLDTAEEE